MLTLFAALMAAPASPAPERDLVEIFRQACMMGEARFSPGTVSPMERDRLPALFTSYLARTPARGLGPVTSASYYRIAIGDAAGFLAVEKRSRRIPEGQTCSLVGKPIAFMPAVERLQGGSLAGFLPPLLMAGANAWETSSPLGYVLRALSLEGGYVVLQSSSMSEKERRRLVRRLPKAGEVKPLPQDGN